MQRPRSGESGSTSTIRIGPSQRWEVAALSLSHSGAAIGPVKEKKVPLLSPKPSTSVERKLRY